MRNTRHGSSWTKRVDFLKGTFFFAMDLESRFLGRVVNAVLLTVVIPQLLRRTGSMDLGRSFTNNRMGQPSNPKALRI